MRIAVASGKGGTGKTTIATGLAVEYASLGQNVAYFDCDVEAPNGEIFLRPSLDESHAVEVPVPVFDADRCTMCGRCCEACRFNALACLKNSVLAFHELCHGCGVCSIVCPAGAVSYVPRRVGTVESGTAGAVSFVQGRLDVGEAMATPVVRALKERVPALGITVLDSPPGASCPVVETLRGSDRVVLVTEPTPFGLNDLEIAVATVRSLNLPVGVVINRSGIGDSRVADYCAAEGLRVHAVIPEDRRVAEAYARGILPGSVSSEFRGALSRLARELLEPTGRSWAGGTG